MRMRYRLFYEADPAREGGTGYIRAKNGRGSRPKNKKKRHGIYK